jgi:hypothetical protein
VKFAKRAIVQRVREVSGVPAIVVIAIGDVSAAIRVNIASHTVAAAQLLQMENF